MVNSLIPAGVRCVGQAGTWHGRPGACSSAPLSVSRSPVDVCPLTTPTPPPTPPLAHSPPTHPPPPQVGLLDIDICGPSLPKMLGLEGEEIHQSGAGWSPVYVQVGSSRPPAPSPSCMPCALPLPAPIACSARLGAGAANSSAGRPSVGLSAGLLGRS